MKRYLRECDHIESLMHSGMMSEYCPPYNQLANGYDEVEEGQICLSTNVYEDNGYYEEFDWIANIMCYKELYPIEYCPICGREIRYERINKLKYKR